jgi:opacity protein-like surface antigen
MRQRLHTFARCNFLKFERNETAFVKVIVATAIAAACTASFAADGFYAGLGVGAVGGELKLSKNGASTVGKTSTVGLIEGGYAFSLDKDWGVALGATYDFNNTKFTGDLGIHAEGKNHYSLYAQPYWKLSPATSVFAKLGYHSMKTDVSGNLGSASKALAGFGWGFGLRTDATKNIYLQAEASWVDYESKTQSGIDMKPKTTAGILSIGYQF